MKTQELVSLLSARRLFFDGGMGTRLQAAGLAPGAGAETWSVSHPQEVKRVHIDYLKAGANILKSNTFGANPLKYPDFSEMITAGIRLAKEAVAADGKEALVAYDTGPLGQLLRPLGPLGFDEAYDSFCAMMACGEQAGADLILIETQTDLREMRAALLAAKTRTSLPVIVTATFDRNGRMLCGAVPETVAVIAERLGASAVGSNCGTGASDMLPVVEAMRAVSSLPLVCNPNAGLPRTEGGRIVYPSDPAVFAEAGRALAQAGTALSGGCCGTTPDDIRALSQACGHLPCPGTVSRPTRIASDRITLDARLVPAPTEPPLRSVAEALLCDDAESAVDELYDAAENEQNPIELDLTDLGGHEAALRDCLEQTGYAVHAPLCVTVNEPSVLRTVLDNYPGCPGVRIAPSDAARELSVLCQRAGGVPLSS